MDIMPEYKGKIDGIAFNVPVPNGSCVDLTTELKNVPSIDDANQAIKKYSLESLNGIVGYTSDPIVSSDVIGREETMVFDEKATMITKDLLLKHFAGMTMDGAFAKRILDVIDAYAKLEVENWKVAINGFGRIGRSVFRILNNKSDIDVVAINDIFDKEALTYLLKYDNVMGRFPEQVNLEGDILRTQSQSVKLIAERVPSELPWSEMGVDIVIESTGIFRQRKQLEDHLNAGAKRVVLTVPSKDEIDYTVVLGVNDNGLKPEHKIVSNASCTTNCLAPMAKILNDSFGIEMGVINTIHAYTNDQRLADVPHSDWRRSRAAAENVIPTTTGAARAVGKVLPELNGKLDGIAMRVPVPDGSVVDLNVRLNQNVKEHDINEAVRAASENGSLKNVLEYSTLPVVSTDIIGNPHSSIFDAPFTRVVDGNFVKTLNWYDNEWGYSNRVADLLTVLHNLD